MSTFIQLSVSGIMAGLVYSLVAIGIVLIIKASGVFNFAQGALVGLGGLFGYQLVVRAGLPVWISIIATIILAILVGVLIERLTIRPLIGQPLLGVIVMTLALSFAIEGVLVTVWGGPPHEFPLFPTAPIKLGAVAISQEYVWCSILALVAFGLLTAFFHYTMSGLMMRGVAESHQISRALGIKVSTVFTQTWIIATVLAAMGGIMLAALNGADFTMTSVGLKAFPVVLLGGLESIGGAMIGGPIIGLAENLSSYYLDPIVGGGTRDVVPFIIMMIILLVKPYGLFGLERIERI